MKFKQDCSRGPLLILVNRNHQGIAGIESTQDSSMIPMTTDSGGPLACMAVNGSSEHD